VSRELDSRHDVTVTNFARVVLIMALASVVGCTRTDSTTATSTSSGSEGSQSAAPATLSGTFVGVGGVQTSAISLRGCISVRPANSQALPACIVQVDADGNWSLTVKAGSYDVFGDPKGNGGEYACTPDHNPIPVAAGEQVVLNVVCNLP
jgi:hypothetical protein